MSVQKRVTHPRLFLTGANGKLQQMAVGTVLTLSKEQAEDKTLANKLEDVGDVEAIDLTGEAKPKAKAKPKAEVKAKPEADAASPFAGS